MIKAIYASLALLTLTSCANTFNIQGSSNMSALDGRMLYLKVLKSNELKNLDSCEVVHGQFHFTGIVDSVRLAQIFMDDESVMPIVLESGDIAVKIDNTQQIVSGTELNDKLFAFYSKYNQLISQEQDLVHQHDQAIMNGSDMNAVNVRLQAESQRLSQQEDKLVTSFITENFDNVLGPGVFFLVTIGNAYPMLDAWTEDIMSKATDNFKNDAYVKDYYAKAQENQQIMTGMKDMPAQGAAPQDSQAQIQAAPTPNKLAQPADSVK